MPKQHGCITNGCCLPENIPTIAQVLADYGYRTHSVGKMHYQPYGDTSLPGSNNWSWERGSLWQNGDIQKLPENYYGFQTADFIGGHGGGCFGEYVNDLKKKYPGTYEKYQRENAYYSCESASECWRMDVPAEIHYNNWIADKTIQFLDNLNEDEQFFLWCSFPDPHHPFTACKPYSEMYDPNILSITKTWNEFNDDYTHLKQKRIQYSKWTCFDEKGLREIVAQTYGMITHIDDNIGRITSHLEEKGLDKDTVILFLSDHGEFLGSHHLTTKSYWMYEDITRIPFIIKAPGMCTALTGKKESSLVSTIDIVPTILDYAGIPQKEMDMRVIHYSRSLTLPGKSLKSYLTEGTEMEDRPVVIEFDDDWLEGDFYRERVIITKKYKMIIFPVAGGGMLFDLENDPDELNNLYEQRGYEYVRHSLTERLLIELIKTDRLDTKRYCPA